MSRGQVPGFARATAKGATPDLTRPDDLDAIASFVSTHRRLMVLTGAGVSTPSGIPDYRDADGHWKRGQPVQHARFMTDPGARQRYWARSFIGWPAFASASPNPAHRALAALEAAGRIHHLVTQNVDGLHQRAGSRRVLDLHGRLDVVDCQDCGMRLSRHLLQERLAALNPDFAALGETPAPDGDAVIDEVAVRSFNVPTCARCGGRLKPGVVFFGDAIPPPRQQRALEKLASADALLVIGSSLMVFSGYRLVRDARQAEKPVALINLGRTRADADMALRLIAECATLLPRLVEALPMR